MSLTQGKNNENKAFPWKVINNVTKNVSTEYGHIHQAKGKTGASPGTHHTLETNKNVASNISNVQFSKNF